MQLPRPRFQLPESDSLRVEYGQSAVFIIPLGDFKAPYSMNIPYVVKRAQGSVSMEERRDEDSMQCFLRHFILGLWSILYLSG